MQKLNQELIESKVSKLKEYIQRLENFEVGEDDFLEEIDLQDLLVFRLTRSVEIAIDIATHLVASLGLPRKDTTKEAFSLLGKEGILTEKTAQAMAKAVGFRNLAVHEYDAAEFDIQRVFRDYKTDVSDLKMYVNEVIKFLNDSQDA